MKKVITYGTFDLIHQGHINILKRAKKLGDYLIVAVTGEAYDLERGKLNVSESLDQRINNVKETGLADQIIVEEKFGQKINDIQQYNIDVFVVGDDWRGKFDYLNEYCEVVYLPRTKGISSTQLRSKNIVKIGIIGTGRIAKRFIPESKFVSGCEVIGAYNPNLKSAKDFSLTNNLYFYTNNLDELYKKIDAVYIASPHITHIDYIKSALKNDKHVLCEKPISLEYEPIKQLYDLSKRSNLILTEALKTSYLPGFNHLYNMVKSGFIGEIKSVTASISMLRDNNLREMQKENNGGSMNELASYALLPIFKILGTKYKSIKNYPFIKNGVDHWNKGIVDFGNGITGEHNVGLGVKTDGSLVISGTKGYFYVPSPWWKTTFFEIRYENHLLNKKYFFNFEGDGLRYELNEFIRQINNKKADNIFLPSIITLTTTKVIENFNKKYLS